MIYYDRVSGAFVAPAGRGRPSRAVPTREEAEEQELTTPAQGGTMNARDGPGKSFWNTLPATVNKVGKMPTPWLAMMIES
jgi:hypothetical protein